MHIKLHSSNWNCSVDWVVAPEVAHLAVPTTLVSNQSIRGVKHFSNVFHEGERFNVKSQTVLRVLQRVNSSSFAVFQFHSCEN